MITLSSVFACRSYRSRLRESLLSREKECHCHCQSICRGSTRTELLRSSHDGLFLSFFLSFFLCVPSCFPSSLLFFFDRNRFYITPPLPPPYHSSSCHRCFHRCCFPFDLLFPILSFVFSSASSSLSSRCTQIRIKTREKKGRSLGDHVEQRSLNMAHTAAAVSMNWTTNCLFFSFLFHSFIHSFFLSISGLLVAKWVVQKGRERERKKTCNV